MKIVHIAQFLGIGGLEKIIYHLALEQQKMGHEVAVYVYDHEQAWVNYFRESGITVITPPLKKAGYDFSLIKRMHQDFKKFEILHTHDLNPLMYVGPLLLLKKLFFIKKQKLIHSTHGLDHIDNYPRGLLYQKIFARMADTMVAVSEKIGDFYLNRIGLNKNKVRVIPNGIALYEGLINEQTKKEKKEWITKKHELDINLPLFISLSRVVPLKDQELLMKALQERPEYQLIIAGPSGDDSYYEKLKTLQKKNIKLIGAQSQVSEYNLGCDLYLSASTHEGIPVAVLEAMAVETPCLVSDIPGHLTLNSKANTVATFKVQNKDDFINQLDKVMQNFEQIKIKAKEARQIVKDHYSVHSMVKSYLEVYKK